jgi:amidase
MLLLGCVQVGHWFLGPVWLASTTSGDTAGPMARSVTDLVQLLDVIAGVDRADPATAEASVNTPPTYMAFLKRDGAVGRRIGMLRQASSPGASDPQVLALFDRAVADLHRAGAEIIDPFVIPEFDQFPPSLHPLSEVRAAIERYLARTGPTFPKSLLDIMASGKFHPLHEVGLLATASAPAPDEDPVVEQLEANEARMRIAYLAAMDEMRIDVVAFPTATYPPKLNGDRNTTPPGTLSGVASALHWPAAVVPMGYSHESLANGLQFMGRPWSEPVLIEIAYAYEQETRHRVPPSTVPPLRD